MHRHILQRESMNQIEWKGSFLLNLMSQISKDIFTENLLTAIPKNFSNYQVSQSNIS